MVKKTVKKKMPENLELAELAALADENWKLRRIIKAFYRWAQKEYLIDSMSENMREAAKMVDHDQMKPGTPCRAACGAMARTIGYEGAWCVYISSTNKEIYCDRVSGPSGQTELPWAERPERPGGPGSEERVLPTDAEVRAATSVLVKMAMTRP